MKKLMLFILMSVMSLGLIYGQEENTSAPDEGETSVTVTGEASADEISVSADISVNKEIVIAEGIIYNDGKNDYASPDVQFALNATDEGSGVKNIFVILDETESFDYLTTGEPISVDEEGKHIIAYRVVDNVGNSSYTKSYKFIMDATPPEIILSTVQDVVSMNDVTYLAPYHEITLAAYDRLSGVASIEYAVDGGEYVTYDSNTVMESNLIAGLSDGSHTITYRGIDNVGNTNVEAFTYEFFVDSVDPTVSISVNPEPYVDEDGNQYISGDSLVFIDAEDGETAIDQILYKIDDGDWMEYDYAFFMIGGDHIVTAKAIDLSGNESAEVTLEVTVDADNPEGEIVPIK